MDELTVENLHAGIEGKKILKGVNFRARTGEVHAIMGPNGSGKSTLSSVIMGHPKYSVESGDIKFNGKSIMAASPDERAKKGLFLSFQYPFEIAGMPFVKFLHAAYKAHYPLDTMSIVKFREKIKEAAKELHMGEDFIERELNVGFSGGEKKRAEILQMMLLKPKIAILDETDSGLDIDSLKLVANAVDRMRSKDFGAVVITHYQRILNYLKPDFVHIMHDGKIIKSGGIEIAEELEKKGYADILKEAGVKVAGVKLQ
ncbi:MAG TPA: Fe-S cluster assembly ATPase SufC [archaeon]|nr:Fe-S cluster assembly ATPase SufC [archaeon]